jgi:hypothetical protein
MKDVMLDLETMGRSPDGAIATIGAVRFDLVAGIIEEVPFYRVVDLSSSARVGMDLDPETVKWWLAQSEEARCALLGDPDTAVHLRSALGDFVDWYPKGARVWGNGATFDVVIMRTAFQLWGLEPPWHYRAERDVRTLVGLWRDLRGGGEHDPTERFEDPRGKPSHRALDDAAQQAVYCCDMYRDLKEGF